MSKIWSCLIFIKLYLILASITTLPRTVLFLMQPYLKYIQPIYAIINAGTEMNRFIFDWVQDLSKVIGLKKINRCSKELTKIRLKKISHSQFKSREFHSHFHSYSTQIRSKNVRQGAIFKQLFFATTYPPTRTSESKRAKTGHLFVKVTLLLPYLTQKE